MSSTQRLRGRVTDAAGAAAPGPVTVHRFSLRAASRVVRLKAKQDGTFEMPIGIPAVILAASTLGGAGAAPATGYEPNFTLKLHPRSEIRGRVLGFDGAPLAGVKVTQVYVLRFAEKLVYATPPNDRGRVERRGKNIFLAPCFCLSGVVTTDEEGLFRLFGLPSCDGEVLLQFVPPAGARGTASDSVWLSAAKFGQICLSSTKGAALRLPDGTPLDALPLEPADPAVRDEPLPELMEAHEQRLAWLRRLREEIVGDTVDGRPPSRKSARTDVIPPLAEALNEGDREIRAQAIAILACMNAPETLPVLREAARHDDPVVRRDALIGLGWLGRYGPCRKPAVGILRRVVDEGDPSLNIPLAAAAALVELGERVEPGLFYDALRRNDADERVAARGLAALLRRDAIELILTRMEASEHRSLLGVALEALTGATYGERIDLWKSWFESHRATLPRQVPTTDRLPDAPAYVRRAWERFCRRDLRGARADLEATLKRDGPGTEALELRARIRMEEGDLEGAAGDADHAIRLNPRAATAKALRAEILERKAGLPTPTP